MNKLVASELITKEDEESLEKTKAELSAQKEKEENERIEKLLASTNSGHNREGSKEDS